MKKLNNKIQDNIKKCYATWADNYFEKYYKSQNAYPPIHVKIVKDLLRKYEPNSLLDAGCGPASMLRLLDTSKINTYGFDLTPEMIKEAQKIMKYKGIPSQNLWVGSVLNKSSFKNAENKLNYESVLCFGVLPHVQKKDDKTIIKNLHSSLKRNGIMMIEARNKLFSLFSLNRYSFDFFVNELINFKDLNKNKLMGGAEKDLKKHFKLNLPKIRKGENSKPGYDEILSRTHNPILLKQMVEDVGFKNVRLLFYHYHCLPPIFEEKNKDAFRRESLRIENPYDWRGYFMASAFIIVGEKK